LRPIIQKDGGPSFKRSQRNRFRAIGNRAICTSGRKPRSQTQVENFKKLYMFCIITDKYTYPWTNKLTFIICYIIATCVCYLYIFFGGGSKLIGEKIFSLGFWGMLVNFPLKKKAHYHRFYFMTPRGKTNFLKVLP